VLAQSRRVHLDELSAMLAGLKTLAKSAPGKIALDYAGTTTA
jgi:hypothetical protein